MFHGLKAGEASGILKPWNFELEAHMERAGTPAFETLKT
jgi:hypothetical protein